MEKANQIQNLVIGTSANVHPKTKKNIKSETFIKKLKKLFLYL